MRRNIRALILALVSPLVFADSYTTLLHRYEQQIQQQKKQLEKLRGRLGEKELDVLRWRAKADEAKAAWSEAGASLEEWHEKVKRVHEKRIESRVMADAAHSKLTENSLIADSALAQAGFLARELYGMSLLSGKPRAEALEESAPEILLSSVARLSAAAQNLAAQSEKEELVLRTEEMRRQNEEQARSQEIEQLHQRQESQWLRWQQALQRKTALDEEINEMDQSAKALQVMVQELREHRDQTLALRQDRSVSDPALNSLRGSLPWPAQGKIVQNFGRQYPDGLQQLVVSNGIKIEAGINHTVRVIQDGKVLFADAFRNYGQLVIVQHRNGLTSVYAGLGQTHVREGQMLAALDEVGATGSTGSFYFELRREEQPINPLVYLAPAASAELSSRRIR